jgi:RNA polymerase sigma-70 factor, ECF subfamily
MNRSRNVLESYGVQMIEPGWESYVEPLPRKLRALSPGHADPDYFLILRVQDGNMDAFDTLVAKYKQPIVNFAARALGDPMEAQDVAQNAFVSVFKKSRRFRFACRFSTWLFSIARNLCRNELRRRWRHRADLLGREDVEGPDFARWQSETGKLGNVPTAVFRRELEEKIEQALESLPERERTAILLLQDEDLSYADVAAVLGTSQSATKTLIFRGRQALKQVLRPYLLTGAWGETWAEAFRLPKHLYQDKPSPRFIYLEMSRTSVSLLAGRSSRKPATKVRRKTSASQRYGTLRGSTW